MSSNKEIEVWALSLRVSTVAGTEQWYKMLVQTPNSDQAPECGKATMMFSQMLMKQGFIPVLAAISSDDAVKIGGVEYSNACLMVTGVLSLSAHSPQRISVDAGLIPQFDVRHDPIGNTQGGMQ
jgi:hypothetical protein